jgi:hypothetical protein
MRAFRLALFAIAFALPLSARAQARPVSVSPIEVRISGPRLIRRGDALKFLVTFNNRTDKPIALRLPRLLEDTTKLNWRVTDTSGRLLPPHIYTGPALPFCPITSPLSDWDIEVLGPHETRDYSYRAGDPSDDFSFPGKGFYRVSLTYILDPSTPITKAPYEVPSNEPDPYTPDEKLTMFKQTPRIETISNEWQLYLID